MNDDLKAYVDGELPPDAAERIRAALDADPMLRREAEGLRALGAALRALPEPEPVGREATLAALAERRHSLKRTPLLRLWAPALAGCAALLLVAVGVQAHQGGRWRPVIYPLTTSVSDRPVVATIPSARRAAFIRYVHSLGGQVRWNVDGLRAFYPQAAHEDLKRRFLLPEDLPWPTDGLRLRLEP